MFRTAAVFSFFRTVTFSQELFFQKSVVFGVKILQSSHFLRTGSSLRQVLFGTAIFLEELFRIKLYKKELLFQSRHFCTASTFSEKLRSGKNRFFRKSIYALPTFSGELSFQSNYFFKRRYLLQKLPFEKGYFFTTCFFRRVAISQLRFLSTVNTSYLFVSNYVNLVNS